MKCFKTFLLCLSLLLIFSCQDVLDVDPVDQITDKAVWEDAGLMEAYVNNMYLALGLGEFHSTSGISDATDEAMWVNGMDIVVQSNITPDNRDVFDGSRFDYLNWSDLYSNIRKANVFLNNTIEDSLVQTSSFDEQEMERIKRLRGESYFLRAYFYHNLLRVYGGSPIVNKVYGIDDEDSDYKVERNSFGETVDFIKKDVDSATTLLPIEHSDENLGRVTKGAAMALKSRVLVHSASDLYNKNPSGSAYTGHVDINDQDKQWKEAKEAAKEVIDLNAYELYNKIQDSAAANYSNLFLDVQDNPEIIFARYTSTDAGAPNVGQWFSPNGYHGWSEGSPVQQMVDAYRMIDGSKFSWDKSEHATNPYENRDPRFYASVFYDGAPWRERYSDGREFDKDGIVQTFVKLTLPDGSNVPGIDTRDGPIEDWNGSYTHYNLRKFLDPDNDHREIEQEVPWIYMRYGEVLLNYAEASIELGDYEDARQALNEIRKRAGMPKFSSSLSGDELKKEYRNERRVELAFEQSRFYDIRRWMIAPDVMNEDAKGIEISAHGEARNDRSTYYDYQYKIITTQERIWDDKMYFLPIPQDEMDRNDKLEQNPGY